MLTAVSLTKGGIPRSIPSFYRRRIRQGDDTVVKIFLVSSLALSSLSWQRRFALLLFRESIQTLMQRRCGEDESKPLAKYASVLRLIPMDGTFNQLAPLDRMKCHRGCATSVDLKSATDRWPLLLLFKVMCALKSRHLYHLLQVSLLATTLLDRCLHYHITSLCGVKFTNYAILGFHISSRHILSRRCGRHALRKWIPPEVISGVIQYLRDFMDPKDIVLPPNELYRSWMDQYLIYLKWYSQVVLDPYVTIDQITSDPSIYIRTWYMPEVDLSTFRYGIMFRVIDVVGCLLNSGINFFPLNQTP
ncbi:hypothetical protein M9H77_18958 [Catharanthus roseus]|uniref:Uncharacterized protein n=1 Tax=Catharanthus roseus TaxID=4058 RepID=A0ACC0B8X4_CATRO|nr:hypothetical protein M9H77_18958 [Catharanthus roseus]